MNIKGFNPEGKLEELQTSSNNESFIVITRRFQRAVLSSPSVESETEFKSIIKEMSERHETDYERMLIFQCSRELAKSLMKRGVYEEAKEYLIQMLKIDEKRVNLWADLAICAEKTNNRNLMEAATRRVAKLRPELSVPMHETGIPDLEIDPIQPDMHCFTLQAPSWTCFLSALESGNTQSPFAILELEISGLHSYDPNVETDYEEPRLMKVETIEERDSRTQSKIGSCKGLYDMIVTRLKAQQISDTKFLFNKSIREVTGETINILTSLNYMSMVPQEVAMKMIDIGQLYVYDLLTTNAKLFLAELASIYQPLSVEAFLEDLMEPYFHKPNVLVRINFVLLEFAIRVNDDTKKLMKIYNACNKYFTEPIRLNHTGRVITADILKEKLEQISILTTLDDPQAERTAELAKKWLPAGRSSLQFLSLKNIVRLFLQFKDQDVSEVVGNFLHMILPLIKMMNSDFKFLIPLFNRLHYPVPNEAVKTLEKIFIALTESKAPNDVRFECALSLGYASANYDGRGRLLAKVHQQLGCCCSQQNGKFLELLIVALISSNANETDITKAFSCYFSNFTLPSYNHSSKLVLRCSPLLQPFYEHLRHLQDTNNISNHALFRPYLDLWLHYVRERDSKSKNPCLHDIDGWKIYKVIKKKENNISKLVSLPRGMSPTSLLEDMLRNDPTKSPESRYALSKVIITQCFAQKIQEFSTRGAEAIGEGETTVNEKFEEALEILQSSEQTPWIFFVVTIIQSFVTNNIGRALNALWQLQPFQNNPKREARRLYWIMRYGFEIGTPSSVKMAQAAAMTSLTVKNILKQCNTPVEYFIIMDTMIGKVLNQPELFQEAIDLCKNKVVLPHPYVEYFKTLTDPKDEFKFVSKAVKGKSMNINIFVHFDYKIPFLMAAPDDYETFKRELLIDYVQSAVNSGNYLTVFPLVNPNNKIDRKLSKVFRDNRYIYGVDRVVIFIEYIAKVIDEYKTTKKKDFSERAIDAMIKGNAILDLREEGDKPISEDLLNRLTPLVETLRDEIWVKEFGSKPAEGSSVNDLLNALYETDDEEEDEEEDEDFVDDEGDDDDEDGTYKEGGQLPGGDEEEEEPEDNGEEEEPEAVADDAEEDEAEDNVEEDEDDDEEEE